MPAGKAKLVLKRVVVVAAVLFSLGFVLDRAGSWYLTNQLGYGPVPDSAVATALAVAEYEAKVEGAEVVTATRSKDCAVVRVDFRGVVSRQESVLLEKEGDLWRVVDVGGAYDTDDTSPALCASRGVLN